MTYAKCFVQITQINAGLKLLIWFDNTRLPYVHPVNAWLFLLHHVLPVVSALLSFRTQSDKNFFE